jgi:TIGR04076 family protein
VFDLLAGRNFFRYNGSKKIGLVISGLVISGSDCWRAGQQTDEEDRICSTNAESQYWRPRLFPEYQEKYLADPKSGPCPCFQKGDTFLLKRTPEQDDFYHLMNGKFCGEAWDAIGRYVYTALQGGSIMHKWTNDERMMIACCNDGTRPVIFKIERIDIPENEEEKQWLEKQNFKNTADDAYTG